MKTRFLTLIFALIALMVGWMPARAPVALGQGIAGGNVTVTLKSDRASVAPGGSFTIVIDQKIAPNWHTYWRNPGDSGEPTSVTWTLPQGVTAGPISWPTPSAIPFGPLVNYGYSDQVLLPVTITVPASASVGSVLDLQGHVQWLECEEICIPGEAKVSLKMPVAATPSDGPDATTVQAAIAALPKPFAGTATLTDAGDGSLKLAAKGGETPRKAYFFPHEVKNGALIDFAQPQEFNRSGDGFALTMVKSTSIPPDLSGNVGGVLVLGDGKNAVGFEVQAAFGGVLGGGAATTPSIAPSSPLAATPIGLWAALGMALLGGLILNLMPCVFPILSMKALGLMEASHGEAKRARAHGLWYGAGVIVCFLALAAILIGFTAAGTAIGWGFQLQNPAVVIGLMTLMVLIGFNLLGFFNMGSGLQNVGGSLAGKNDGFGAFSTGVLAVIVAAPCTAPFMGAALGFAATQTPSVAMLVFLALAIGFALPFVVLTFTPVLLRALPRPGPWMEKLRQGLAFPMFGTAVWLAWIASAQAGQAGVLAALVGILGVGFGVWVARAWPNKLGQTIGALVAVGTLFWSCAHVLDAPTPTKTADTTQLELDRTWSPSRVATLQSEGKTVFVNFTADWCVTCKVNEVSVLSNEAVRGAMSNDKVVYLVADWTLRDDEIAKELASHGRVGVPLYLVYKPGATAPKVLPQILNRASLLEALKP